MLLRRKPAGVVLLVILTALAAVGESNLKTEDVLQKYLDSVGTAQARAASKSRVVEGTLAYRVLVGGSGEIQGNGVIVSEADKLQMRLKINALQYHGERFQRNGDKTFVAGTYDDSSRSEFGDFLRSEDVPLREGLLGGVWSAGWPLISIDPKKSKLHYDGLKKVDGRDLHVVQYHGKKNTGLDITLYFEPDTFRHVMTIYKASVHAGISAPTAATGPLDGGGLSGGADVASARQQQTRYRIEERFSDFKDVEGLTLPSRYNLRFQEELQTGFTKMVEWDMTSTRVLNNVTLDSKNFEIH